MAPKGSWRKSEVDVHSAEWSNRLPQQQGKAKEQAKVQQVQTCEQDCSQTCSQFSGRMLLEQQRIDEELEFNMSVNQQETGRQQGLELLRMISTARVQSVQHPPGREIEYQRPLLDQTSSPGHQDALQHGLQFAHTHFSALQKTMGQEHSCAMSGLSGECLPRHELAKSSPQQPRVPPPAILSTAPLVNLALPSAALPLLPGFPQFPRFRSMPPGVDLATLGGAAEVHGGATLAPAPPLAFLHRSESLPPPWFAPQLLSQPPPPPPPGHSALHIQTPNFCQHSKPPSCAPSGSMFSTEAPRSAVCGKLSQPDEVDSVDIVSCQGSHSSCRALSVEKCEAREPQIEKADGEKKDGAENIAERQHKLLMSRSNSESSLEHDGAESEETVEAFVPQNCLRSWEYPLSQSEKRLLHTRLCDLERGAAVLECKHLRRRMSVAATCDEQTSQLSGASESGDDEQDAELQAKQRELERQLRDVRKERRRLSLSRP